MLSRIILSCSRQTIHDLMNRDCQSPLRPCRARVTNLRPYRTTRQLTHVIISTSNHYCSAFTGFMHKISLIISCKITEMAFSSMTMQDLTQRVNNAQNNVNVLPWPDLSQVMNPIEHV